MTSKAQAIVFAVNFPPQAPAPGAGDVLEVGQLLLGHVALLEGADRLEDVLDRHVLALAAARGDRAAVEQHGRDVDPLRAPSRAPGIVLSQAEIAISASNW